MVLSMSWMAVVGIRGPQHDAARTHDISVDDEDVPSDQRDDELVSDTYTYAPPARGASSPAGVTSAEQPAQTPAERPPVVPDAMSAAESPVPAATPSQPATQAAPAASTAPKADTKKAPSKKATNKKAAKTEKKAAPKTPVSEVSPNTFVVGNVTPEAFEAAVPKDEHDAWDDFGDFWGAFNPFMASMAALPPEYQEWKEDVIEQYVDSTPPEREEIVDQLEDVLPALTEGVGDTPSLTGTTSSAPSNCRRS